ncbi:hypothetical protein TYRP_002289 [Tyrophagus putrescentiae]|nr:hypothetical protein TYRP_002289 [Tyrophagus putrescentiae]
MVASKAARSAISASCFFSSASRLLLADPRLRLRCIHKVLVHLQGVLQVQSAAIGLLHQRRPGRLKGGEASPDLLDAKVLSATTASIAARSQQRLRLLDHRLVAGVSVGSDLRQQSLLFLNQRLDAHQVAAAIRAGRYWLLLRDPRHLVLNVAEELLHLQRLVQPLAARAFLRRDRLCVKVLPLGELGAPRDDLIYGRPPGGHLRLHRRLLLQQMADGVQVSAIVLHRQRLLNLAQPQLDVLHFAVVRLLGERILQLRGLVRQRRRQLRPQAGDLRRLRCNVLRRVVVTLFLDGFSFSVPFLLHHNRRQQALRLHRQLLNALLVGGDLALKVPVLLLLPAQIGQLVVVLIQTDLQPLHDPELGVVVVDGELLVAAGIGQHGRPRPGALHQPPPAVKKSHPPLFDLLRRVVPTLDQLPRKLVQRVDLLLVGGQRLKKVVSLHRIERVTEVGRLEESILLDHPVVRLFSVAQKELQVHALLVEDASLLPEQHQGHFLVVQLVQLFAYLERPPLGLGGLEGVLAGVNLALVLLVPLQEDLRTGHVLRQLLAADGRLHQLNPPHNVAVVGEELLQLVGLVQALPPLGRLLLQRRPVTLQLEAFGEYVLGAVALGGQVSLQNFVLSLGGLDGDQRLSPGVRSSCSLLRRRKQHRTAQQLVLLGDPAQRLHRLLVKAEHLVGALQLLTTSGDQPSQTLPGGVHRISSLEDDLRLLVSLFNQPRRPFVHLHQTGLLAGHVLQQLVKLALQHVHVLDGALLIGAAVGKVVRGERRLAVADPEKDLLALAGELQEDERFAEKDRLTVSVQRLNGLHVGGHLRLESLMLLNLSGKVRWLAVALLGDNGQLLPDPAFQLVGVSLEVLVALRVLQLVPLVLGVRLEEHVLAEDGVSPLLDVVHRLQHLGRRLLAARVLAAGELSEEDR